MRGTKYEMVHVFDENDSCEFLCTAIIGSSIGNLHLRGGRPHVHHVAASNGDFSMPSAVDPEQINKSGTRKCARTLPAIEWGKAISVG